MKAALTGIAEVLAQIPPEWRPFFALAIGLLVYLVLKKKGIINGNGVSHEQVEALRAQVSGLETEVGNHLTSAIKEQTKELATALGSNTAAVAELSKQVGRTADIQISTSQNLNRLHETQAIICDRLRVDRPDFIKLPTDHVTPHKP